MYIGTIGYEFRMLRFQKNLSQQQVANIIGVKLSTLSRIENNKGKARKGTLMKLATFYGMELSQLVDKF